MQYHTMLFIIYAIAYYCYLTCDVIVTMLYANDVMNNGLYIVGYRLYYRLYGLTNNMPRGILGKQYPTNTLNHQTITI